MIIILKAIIFLLGFGVVLSAAFMVTYIAFIVNRKGNA